MTCFNPKLATFRYGRNIDQKTGEIVLTKRLHFLPWAKVNTETPFKKDVIIIPCGKCQGCQIDRANEWATRVCMEIKNYKNNAFLTLTYDNEHLPKQRSLIKKDLQDFWKRLRKTGEKIRYLACGEYGPRTARPHYHAVVLNYWPKDAKIYKKNITGDTLYTSERLNKIWGNGYVIVGQVNYETAAYVARYVYKKAFGLDKNYFLKKKKAPEFTLSSRRPGLGMEKMNDEKWQKILRNDGIIIKTKTGVIVKKIPQFIKLKWRKFGDRQEYYQWADERAREFKALTRTRIEKTSDNWFQANKKNAEILREKLKKLDKRGKTE